jgi:O-antigen/teichoic acid export membrane protein
MAPVCKRHRTREQGITILPETNLQEPETAIEDQANESLFSAGMRRIFPAKLLGVSYQTARNRFIPWVHKGGCAVLDQGLISGSNFILSILLARWLLPEQYGAYAVAFGFFILVSLVYSALVLEPMAVFGGSSYRDRLRGYLGSVMWIHVAMSLALVVVFGVSAFVVWKISPQTGLAAAIAGVTIASPCILLFSLARRTFYLELSPAKAAVGALVYCGMSLACLYLVYRRAWLSPFSAFLILGVAALATSIYLFARLYTELRPSTMDDSVGLIWGRHWRYGSWALLSCVASWIPANIYYPLLSSFGTMAQSGQLKALMNFTLPVEQVKGALGLLFLPYAASVLEREGRGSGGSLSRRMTLVAVGVALAYWVVVLATQRSAFHALYSGRYMEVAHLLPIVAIGSIAWCGSFGSAIALRAMESPASVFIAFGLSTVVSTLVGIPATRYFGLTGAVWGMNVSDLLSWMFLIWLLRRKMAGRSFNFERFLERRGARQQVLPEEFPAD